MNSPFISLKHIITKLVEQNIKIDIICLIKPQFECGKEIANKFKGVIRSKEVHISILKDIISYFKSKNYYLYNLDVSPIHGGDGNIEYLAYFGTDKKRIGNISYNDIVEKAFK